MSEIPVPAPDPCALAHRAAHDLRGPLARACAFAELVRENRAGALDAEDLRALEIVSRSVREAGGLAERLLALALAAQRPLERRRVDLRAAVERALETLAEDAERAGASVAIGELGSVAADPELLETLLRELLANAIAFGAAPGADGPRVSVTVDATDSGAPSRLRLADSGPGIAPELRDRALEPFASGEAADGGPRTGLGLTLCRTVCDRHGWSLGVRAEGPGMEIRVGFG